MRLKIHLLNMTVFILMFVHLPVLAKWHEKTFHVMGTEARVQLWQQDKLDAELLIQAVIDEMNRIDQSMSPYIATSELSKVNQQGYINPVMISDELFTLISQAQSIAELSQGAFDITYASIGYQYDYRNKHKPEQLEIDKALPAINYQSIVLNPKNKNRVKNNKTMSFWNDSQGVNDLPKEPFNASPKHPQSKTHCLLLVMVSPLSLT